MHLCNQLLNKDLERWLGKKLKLGLCVNSSIRQMILLYSFSSVH